MRQPWPAAGAAARAGPEGVGRRLSRRRRQIYGPLEPRAWGRQPPTQPTPEPGPARAAGPEASDLCYARAAGPGASAAGAATDARARACSSRGSLARGVGSCSRHRSRARARARSSRWPEGRGFGRRLSRRRRQIYGPLELRARGHQPPMQPPTRELVFIGKSVLFGEDEFS